MEQFGSNNGDPLNMRNSRERQWAIQDDENRMRQESHDSQQANAQLMRKAEEDRQFQQNQNDFARTFGRGLTGGAASTRGNAGKSVSVNPNAIQGMQQKNESYFNSDNIASAGNISRAMTGFEDIFSGGDDKAIRKASDTLIKSINDSPMSSQTKISGVTYDPEKGYTFIGEDGKTAVNKTPITNAQMMDIGKANSLFGTTVNQRQAGTGQGMGMGGGSVGGTKSSMDAAKLSAQNRYKTESDIHKKMFDAKDDMTGKSTYTQEQLLNQYNKVLQAERYAQGMMQSASGMGGDGGNQPPSMEDSYKMAQGLLDNGNNPQEVLDYMWKQGTDRNTMDILTKQLSGQGMQQQAPQQGRGLQQQQQQQQQQQIPQQTMQGQVIQGQGMQGQGIQQAPQQQQQQQQQQAPQALQAIEQNIAGEQAKATADKELKLANKVFEKEYNKLMPLVNSGKAGKTEIKALYSRAASDAQRKKLEALYEIAVRRGL